MDNINEKYDKFINVLADNCGSFLGAHFTRRWKPFQMPSDDKAIETFRLLGVSYKPTEPKWWYFKKKSIEKQFIEAINKIKLN